MSVDTPDRPPPRPHHLKFKYAVVATALRSPSELVARCEQPDELLALWHAIGSDLDERLEPTGLSARNVGDAQRPVLMIMLPAPERPNEAYYLCAVPRSATIDRDGSLFIPDPSGPLELRIFGMERSMLPDGGLIGFVVEWTNAFRHNYDAPDNASPSAFWKAILEVFAGTRSPIHSMAIQTGN
jgi:hypothetical protein